MTIISIGIQCTNALFKQGILGRTQTLPFDWMLSTPSFVFEMLNLLLEQNMDVEELVKKHFFYCEKKTTVDRIEHYYTCEDGGAPYNAKYNVIFPHDTVDNKTIDKYIRRFERLKDIILHSTDDLYFIYTSQSSLTGGNFTIDGNIIIRDVYVNLSKIYNLISKFRNKYKMIAFDAIHEEPIELLDSNITLCKLKPQEDWSKLLPEMRNYKLLLEKS